MKAGVLLNSHNKLAAYSQKFLELLACNGIPHRLIDPNSKTLFADLKECTHLIFHHSQGDTDCRMYDTIYDIATRVFGIKCHPDHNIYWQYEDKIKEYYLLRGGEFPVVETRVFWNREYADAFISETKYPVIVKLPKGAGSENVVLVNSPAEARVLNRQVFCKGVRNGRLDHKSNVNSVRKVGVMKYGKDSLRSFLINAGILEDKSYFPEWQIQKDAILYQKYLHGNLFEQRITIIGKRAFGSRKLPRKNDFRVSGSGCSDFDPGKIDKECIKIAFSISERYKLRTMAYDFLYDENKPVVNEMGYGYADYITCKLPGYWDENYSWHEVMNWPQYYELSDFLETELRERCY